MQMEGFVCQTMIFFVLEEKKVFPLKPKLKPSHISFGVFEKQGKTKRKMRKHFSGQHSVTSFNAKC